MVNNRRAMLFEVVASCRRPGQTRPVIVVFDGPDPEAERIAREFEGVKIVVQPQSRGAPSCRNLGWRLAQTEYVMFLDADDYVEGAFFASAEAAAEAGRPGGAMREGTRPLRET